MEATVGKQVNNDIYHELANAGTRRRMIRVALLRAEARARNPGFCRSSRARFRDVAIWCVLDVGCGGGFLSNALAAAGHEVTGLDASETSLQIARHYDRTARVQYQRGDAYHLPYADESFAVVCAMDFLEHVEHPAKIVAEIARVLAPNGLFFFHTFNRNFLSWLIGIKGVEWFVKNTPPDLHVLRLFIKPAELQQYCEPHGLTFTELRGSAPVIMQPAFWKMLVTGRVEDEFRFKLTHSTWLAYLGYATKMPSSANDK
ncbi:MAG: bifunctional 2-polyprenyl-6-hydroxyphenol methylase/3-demethylubiquinol 3-O-methyltransferase UbiG [Blastocatellia bacterium]